MIEIIPAIDIIGGECVRLTQGDYAQKSTYFTDPLEVAKMMESVGVRRIHLVDLDGAKASSPQNLRVLERVATATALDVQYGGGIKSEQALRDVFSSGARRAICGSVAVSSPDLFREWLRNFGAGHIILGADIKDGNVATHGWLSQSQLTVKELINVFLQDGLTQVICTDISKDGMLNGPSFELYDELQKAYSVINITVSGGISSVDDILRLDEMGLRSVIVGKAFYEGHITLKQIEQCMQKG